MAATSIRKATLINFIGKYTNIFIQLIYSAILSRILTPEDFGVVAVVAVFTSFFILIANMGIGPAVIQNQNIDEEDTNNIYTFTIYLGILFGILFALFSIPLSIFYGDSVYISIGALLSISIFFNTLNIVPNAILLKKHRFKLVSVRMVVVSIISAIPTIILANIGFKYYAIVIHSILIAFLTFLWNYSTVKPKYIFKIEKKRILKIKEFSSYQLAFSFINYFSRNLDNLLIGKFIGSAALGYYDKSYKLMLYPVQNLTHVITPVLHPILSTYQNDKKYIFDQYMKVVKILSLLGVFVSAYSFFAAEEIVLLLFGNQWVASVPSFQLLALSIWAQMVTSSSGAIFQSLGNTKLLFIVGVTSSVLIVSSILIGISFNNINAVAAFVAIAYNVNFFVTYYILVNKGFGYSVKGFFKKLLPDLVVFIITFSGMKIASQLKVDNLFSSAGYKLITGIIAYLTAILITKQYNALAIMIRHNSKNKNTSK